MVVQTSSGRFSITDYDEMRRCLEKAQVLVGHNIVRFDIPVLEKILGIKIKAKLVDTLALSWYLHPKRPRHGLASYGEDFGISKPEVEDWEDQPLEVYVHRCEEDVRINTHLWNAQWSKLKRIYDTEEEIWKFLEYLTFKMHCAMLQEKSGWKLDIEFTKEQLEKLEKLREEKVQQLAEVMPRIPVYVKKNRPKVMYKQDGLLSSRGYQWLQLLDELNLPEDTEEVETLHSYKEPNPGSSIQIKDWLFSLGWKPQTFKHKDGREIPQINLDQNKGICPSIKALFEIEPNLELLDGLSVLSARIPILRGFLETVDDNGYIQAQIQGLTNTLRFQHSHPCVNLPRSDRPYAQGIRGALIAPEGYELCGADMSGLEDRLKQHFIYPLDPKYVQSMSQSDWDPHLALAILAKKLDPEDKTFYQWYESTEEHSDADKKRYKIIKATRSIFKNGNYACQYGAYPPRLVITCGISLDEAKEVFDKYWEMNWAIKKVASSQKVKTIDDEMWLWNPISGFWYSLRKDNDRFSTLIQGTASYVFDLWVQHILETREQITAQFHDEVVLCVRTGFRPSITEFLGQTIEATNSKLKLNRRLDIGIQYGSRYAEIH